MKKWKLCGIMKPFLAICILSAATGCPREPLRLAKEVAWHGGLLRSYLLYVPESYDGSEPVPLVVALHRFSEDGKDMARMTGFNTLAERHGFIVAYPNAVMRCFNGFGWFDYPDDVAFILDTVDEIAHRYWIDPARTYVTGASNGGFMTYLMACDASDVFAAAAAVMATMPEELAQTPANARKTPILIMHGTEDPIVPYYDSNLLIGRGRPVEVLPIPETVDYWVRHNGCSPSPLRETLQNADPNDQTTAIRETYANGRNNAEVVLYTIVGGGHTWPGGIESFPEFIVGDRSNDFRATEVIWDFFQRHPRNSD